MDMADEREGMVGLLEARGISDPAVLNAFRAVPREAFVPGDAVTSAYRDAPLSIGEGQTISQPYVVALMAEALKLTGAERVLEIGTGSGYAAAILGKLARQVFTIERLPALVAIATERLDRLGFRNVIVIGGDGTLGWRENAPYDAIIVAAGGPTVPQALLAQLAPGGRLVIPVGADADSQVLTRVTRGAHGFAEEKLGEVRFVPLIGAQGWSPPAPIVRATVPGGHADGTLVKLLREAGEPLTELDTTAIDGLIERMGNARVVLLGEATHGTSEFYQLRALITRRLIERGFDFVAVEADWPDAARIDDYVLGGPPRSGLAFTPFSRFPSWMWRNEEVHAFVEWLRGHNKVEPPSGRRVGFHGLDLYSMFTSIAAVLAYLERVDPTTARLARGRYGGLMAWHDDPAAYGRAVLLGQGDSAETEVLAVLRELLERRLEYTQRDGVRFFDAAQNARVVKNAEGYYRAMYHGSVRSWNLRDTHMFETLQALLAFYGPRSRGVVWEHNSHVGNATATELGARGELNVGQLCRTSFHDGAYIVGFGTDHGTVAAASDWDEPVQRMRVRPGMPGSYEALFHSTGVPAFSLHLRAPRRQAVRDELEAERLERAIGVIYRPDTERRSHYFSASLPHQFDELVWIDETRAITPLPAPVARQPEIPETYPFGL